MGNSRAAASRHFQSRGGNTVPRKKYEPDDVAKAQAEVLRERYGDRKAAAKELARDTGKSERACRNHLAGINCMNLAEFFNACQDIPEIQAWGAYMMGLKNSHSPLLQAKLNELAMLVRDHADDLFDDGARQ